MKSTKQKLRLALALVGFGILAGLYGFYDFTTGDSVKWARVRAAKQTELGSLKTELTRVSRFADNIQAIKQEFRELNLQLESALEYLPREYALAQLLRKMTLLAENSGVEIAAFRPRKNDEAIEFYHATDVEFTLKGGFTQSLVFFDQLSRLKRLIKVQSIKFVVADKANGNSGAVPSQISAVIRTYRLGT